MKKTLAIVLALLMMLSVLSACASEPAAPVDTPTTNTPATETPADTPEEPAEEPAEAPAETPSEAPADEPADAPVEAPAETPAETLPGTEVTLPIAAEPTEYSCWVALDLGAVGMEDMNDSPTWQHVSEITNIHMTWTLASTSAKSEQFNLMLVSEQYDDAIDNGAWNQDLSYYIDQDTIIDLADLIANNSPNYTAVRNSDEVVFRDTMLDDGSIGAFYRIQKSRQPSWFGLVVRDDLLNDLGLAMPKTFADVENVLVAFKDAGIEAPLGFSQDGMDGAFLAAYGLAGGQMQGNWLQVNGEAKYAPAMPELKDYLTLMNKWYAAGLIDQAFYGDGTMGFRFDDIAAGMTGMFSTMSTVMSMPVRLSDIEGFSLMPVTNPVLNEGDVRNIALCTSVVNRVEMASTMCVTTACEDPETFVKFIDFFYTEQGAQIMNWGMEGLTFDIDENGNKVYSALLMENPEGLTQRQAMLKHGIDKDAIPHLYDWEAQIGEMIPNAKLIYTEMLWDLNYEDERTWPAGISLNLDETEASASVLGDIETYVDEMIVKFIIGQESLDNFDAYVEKLYEMGLQDAIDAYQTAYDRYMSRG